MTPVALMVVWAICGIVAVATVFAVLACAFLGRQSSRDRRMRARALADEAAASTSTEQYGRRRPYIRRRPQ